MNGGFSVRKMSATAVEFRFAPELRRVHMLKRIRHVAMCT